MKFAYADLFLLASNLAMGVGWWKLRCGCRCWRDVGVWGTCFIVGFVAGVWGWVVFGDLIFCVHKNLSLVRQVSYCPTLALTIRPGNWALKRLACMLAAIAVLGASFCYSALPVRDLKPHIISAKRGSEVEPVFSSGVDSGVEGYPRSLGRFELAGSGFGCGFGGIGRSRRLFSGFDHLTKLAVHEKPLVGRDPRIEPRTNDSKSRQKVENILSRDQLPFVLLKMGIGLLFGSLLLTKFCDSSPEPLPPFFIVGSLLACVCFLYGGFLLAQRFLYVH